MTEPFDVTYEDEVDAGLYPYDESTVLVKLKKKAQFLDADGIAGIEYLFKTKDGFWYTANLSEGTTPKTAIETLRNTNGVLLAEYNYLYEAGATTLCDGQGFHEDIHDNPKHPDEWHLDSCGIQHSWHHIKDDCHKNPGGDSGIIVAVIDTGVDYDHEDLKNNMWVNTGEIPGDGIDNDGNGYVDDYYGVDIVAKKGNGDDDHGHGTHVASIIAAANNNVGVVGVAYNAKIMAIKAGQASGNFLNTDVCKAINYARENGADVINMSFGGSATTIAVQDALEEAYTSCVLVAAAGNDGAPNEERYSGDPEVEPCYPAAYSFVLGVMSVDDYGVESDFTNYDVKKFNDVEYEVYAPGNAITSTIPNNKYATWNGTSMAAPIVSGMAALIRSVYNDPDKYPTKFIYGQLASTSDRTAACHSVRNHGIHNLPKIVNLYDALTKMPKPEVSVSDYATFDSESISKANNGDGTIDSGETITLGFELRNRWGMSEDTVVTIDAISQGGVANPYVEFSADGKKFGDSASVNYGSVGTYSTQDCGKIVENDLFTGWEKPFYVKVSKDAPNETILAINVSVKCKNALDESDKNIYVSEPVTINLIVKNGIVLPQIIDEDMTLTKDNYYIIQNSTVIEEGATVTVTEGTNIQFWTNDSTDPYADSYMAGLVVKGKLNCVGTEDEHVKIFPSNKMRNYEVGIYEKGNGKINYKYTDITNLIGRFTTAENCEFNVNYKGRLNYRKLVSGQVKDDARDQYIYGGTAKNCAFYKLGGKDIVHGGYSQWDGIIDLTFNCQRCIFVDSCIKFSNSYTYEDCVFYGNNNYWDSTEDGGASEMSATYVDVGKFKKIARDETTGKTYVEIYSSNYGYLHERLAEYLGGKLADIKTEEELAQIKNLGISANLGVNNRLIELSDTIRIEEITFARDSVATDTSVTYQLAPQIYPSTASGNKLLYFSSNTDVATVDDNGLVTPVSTGTAKIYAFSEDMQVSGSMEIVVKDEVKATSVKAPESMNISLGETKQLNSVVKPKNTTKSAKYTSSNESVATVDADGKITAVSKGEAVITTTVDNGDEKLTAETKVFVVAATKTLSIADDYIVTKMSEAYTLKPTVTPENATIKTYKWESTNKNVCYVNENDELVKTGTGVAVLKAISDYSDEVYDTVTVFVVSDDYEDKEIKQMRSDGGNTYVLLSDGTIWHRNYQCNFYRPGFVNVTKLDIQFDGTIDDFWCTQNSPMFILSNGTLYSTENYWGGGALTGSDFKQVTATADWNSYTLNNVEKICGNADVFYAACSDGHTFRYVPNRTYFEQVDGLPKNEYTDVYDKVSDIYIEISGIDTNNLETTTFFLVDGENEWDSKSVYVTGKYNGVYYDTATLILKDAVSNFSGGYAIKGDSMYTMLNDPNHTWEYKEEEDNITLTRINDQSYLAYYIDGDENELYTRRIYTNNDYGSDYDYKASRIKNVKNVYAASYSDNYVEFYCQLNDNRLFEVYNGTMYRVLAGVEYDVKKPYFDENSFNLSDVVFDEKGNVSSSVLSDNSLIANFYTESFDSPSSQQVKNVVTNEYCSGWIKTYRSAMGTTTYDLQELINSGEIVPGGTYSLHVSGTNIKFDQKSIQVTFTYKPEEETPVAPTEPEENEGEQKHVHDFTTETVMPTLTEDGKITNTCECGVSNETILPKLTERKSFTEEDYTRLYNEFVEKGYNTNVWHSAILNRLNDTDVTKWLRITAPEGSTKYGFGGNWWGTTNSELINHQIVDYNDFITLGDINEGEILTEAPEDTFPFVTEAYILDESGEVQSVVSGGKVKFVVKFNRDMDAEYGLNVYFGSTYPYGDYQIDGAFTDARTWVGETTLKTVIENGYQFIKVTSGRTAADENGAHLKLYNDWARFGFEIDTTSAMAMSMQGYADNGGIHIEWVQDDYDTLAGYNVYRATSENGNYVRINKTVIPSDENTYYDTDVEPGKQYYYTFTVVLTDVSSESTAAGKISVTAKDTMAPSVYHSPVYTATTGNKVIVTATISDNIGVQNAKLYYRVKGTDEWKVADMTSSNDKYTASIPSTFVTLDGVEYYIAAFDGVNYTYAGGRTSENPYEITVYAAVENNAKGDVDGDGNITVLDALKLLCAIYDNSLLTQEEFLRADINGDGKLSAVEALRILQYANKKISSVLFPAEGENENF